MAIDYQNIKVNVAERLIRENGKPATIIREVDQSGLPPWEVEDPVPTESLPVLMVETDWTKSLRSTETVETWDKIGIISTETGVEPVQQDRIEIGGTEYHLVEVRPLEPGPVTMLYYVTAKL